LKDYWNLIFGNFADLERDRETRYGRIFVAGFCFLTNNVKAKPVARRGRKATGPKGKAGLPFLTPNAPGFSFFRQEGAITNAVMLQKRVTEDSLFPLTWAVVSGKQDNGYT
jgi:hypothetical protein